MVTNIIDTLKILVCYNGKHGLLQLKLRKKEFILTNYTTPSGKHVFSVGMANYLLQRGHKLLEVKENKRVAQASVFLYEDTPDLHKDMEIYKDMREKQRASGY